MSGLVEQRALSRVKPAVPVVAISVHDTDESRCRARDLGASAYLARPVEHEALLGAIGHAMRDRRAGELA